VASTAARSTCSSGRNRAPTGAPPARASIAGYQRLGVTVRDLAATLERVAALGGTVAQDAHPVALEGGHSVSVAHVRDPDGVRLELIGGGVDNGLTFVAVTCADLDASLAWYRALGFEERMRFNSESVDIDAFGLDAPGAIREVFLVPPGRGAVSLILVGFDRPPVEFEAARPANAVGAWRTALVLDDLDAATARLRGAGIELLSDPVSMAMGEGLPELRFVCFAGPDREVLELIESPADTEMAANPL
jgi:catechol 2,3-dioxygenase-like lactoylglutathione lyase family enzyme